MPSEKKERKRSDLSRLLDYAGDRKALTYLGLALSAVSMVLSMMPYICIWLVVRDLVAVAPNWEQATGIITYGWAAVGFAAAGIIVYFCALLCTHLAAFRTATNMRKACLERLMKTQLGYFDTHASGYLRRRIDGAAAETETLLAHNLADIVGTVAMFVATIAGLLYFDWRMGLICIAAMIVSIACLGIMMGGKNKEYIDLSQTALDNMSKAGTEYVRGIPVVKVFQQTVYSFKAFKQSIEDYSKKAGDFSKNACTVPQSLNLTITASIAALLVPGAILLLPGAQDLADYLVNFAFYAIFSAVIATALARIMFASNGIMMASVSLARIEEIVAAPELAAPARPLAAQGNDIEFDNVTFTYEGTEEPALKNFSLHVKSGTTVALVGPSGGGKTTAASLVPRFWDVCEGTVSVGGVNVREADPHALMNQVAFVFQNNRLFKTSILENVRAARPNATCEEVEAALFAARCTDIVAKLPQGLDTRIGTGGVYLSGGEQQRIALARAILKDAPIVVLDEATAFADPENEVLIQAALSQLTAGKTVLMVAHRLSTIVSADNIVVLDKGSVIEQGTHNELVAAGGQYARMWADYQQSAQWKIGKEVA